MGGKGMKKNVYVWGYGKLAHKYIRQISSDVNILGIIDNNPEKWGQTDIFHNGKQLECIKDNLTSQDYVAIAIENPNSVNEIVEKLECRDINWCHIFKLVDESFENSDKCQNVIKTPGKMMRFIDVTVPIAKCNMRCDYCYLSHLKIDFNRVSDFCHTAKYIRYALSQERLGGSAFINLCGVGETLFCENIVEIVDELLKEGHYIQIVTNATPSSIIKKMINSCIDASRIFLKCSLHYEELKRMNMLEIFAKNVEDIEKWGASYTIEYVPTDASVELIPEIKEYCMRHFGALPHVTVTRDERYKDFRVLTEYSLEEYKKIWSQFNSNMFDFKLQYVIDSQHSYCMAGLWAAELNLATGELYQCTNNPRLCNIYQDIDKEIVFKEVGMQCCLPYCFNCHAYVTLGLMAEYLSPSYLEMRDRIKKDGTHWIGEKLRDIFSQKLYKNHENELNWD